MHGMLALVINVHVHFSSHFFHNLWLQLAQLDLPNRYGNVIDIINTLSLHAVHGLACLAECKLQ